MKLLVISKQLCNFFSFQNKPSLNCFEEFLLVFIITWLYVTVLFLHDQPIDNYSIIKKIKLANALLSQRIKKS